MGGNLYDNSITIEFGCQLRVDAKTHNKCPKNSEIKWKCESRVSLLFVSPGLFKTLKTTPRTTASL